MEKMAYPSPYPTNPTVPNLGYPTNPTVAPVNVAPIAGLTSKFEFFNRLLSIITVINFFMKFALFDFDFLL